MHPLTRKSSAASSSKEHSEDDEEGSKADIDSPQPRRRTRSQLQTDLMKDVRQLFTWTDKNHVGSGCGSR